MIPGNFTLDVYQAQAGGAAQLLYHQDLAPTADKPAPDIMEFIGWDQVGPLGTYPTEWATQGGGPAHYFGIPVRVDATTGKVVRQLSDPQSCQVQDIAASGDFVCSVPATSDLSVRRPDGT